MDKFRADAVCDCIIHKGGKVDSNLRKIMQSGISSCFSSNHDVHGINLEFDKITTGKITKKTLKKKKMLVRGLRQIGIDLDQTSLPQS